MAAVAITEVSVLVRKAPLARAARVGTPRPPILNLQPHASCATAHAARFFNLTPRRRTTRALAATPFSSRSCTSVRSSFSRVRRLKGRQALPLARSPSRPDLEWKVTYVGSATDNSRDQVLECVLVGPVQPGTFRFVLQARCLPARSRAGAAWPPRRPACR